MSPGGYFRRWSRRRSSWLAFGWVARAFAHGQIEWSYVGRFITAPVIVWGIVNTLVMAVLAMMLGIVLGVVVAIMRLSPNPVLRSVAAGYTWLFRGTPLILQLLLWFNLALVFPTIGIPGLWSARAVDVMTPFLAALLGLGINQGAYTSEVMRAACSRSTPANTEAAQAIGMGRLQALRRIILPQAMRVVIPPLGNEFIGLVKATSLASVIQYPEVLHSAENIYYANSRVIELLIVAGLWYLAVVSVLANPGCRWLLAAPLCAARRARGSPDDENRLVAIARDQQELWRLPGAEAGLLDIWAGEVVCLIGPSGSGKTSLLRCINQLAPVDSGGIWLDGELLGLREHGGKLHRLSEREIARQRLSLRHGVPALQPVSAHDRAGEHRRGTGPGAAAQAGGRGEPRR